jgi:hypothetical protein
MLRVCYHTRICPIYKIYLWGWRGTASTVTDAICWAIVPALDDMMTVVMMMMMMMMIEEQLVE